MPATHHTPADLERALRIIAALRNSSGYSVREQRLRRAKARAMELEYGLRPAGGNAPNEPHAAPPAPPAALAAPPPGPGPLVMWHPLQQPFTRVYGMVPPRPSRLARAAAALRRLPGLLACSLSAASAVPVRHAPRYPKGPGPVQRAAQGLFDAAVMVELHGGNGGDSR